MNGCLNSLIRKEIEMTLEEMLEDKKWLRKFNLQRYAAKSRNIDWQFTFNEWCNWWIQSGFVDLRGLGKDKYVMCRSNDSGPYSVSNTYCATQSQNAKDLFTGDSHITWKKSQSKRRYISITTPDGQFESIELAAQFYKVTSPSMHYRLKKFPDLYKRIAKEIKC